MTSARSTQGDAEVLKVVGRGTKKKRRWPLLLVPLLLLLAGSAAVIVWKLRATTDTEPRFQTQRVERGDLKVTVTATGTLNARNSVEVGSEITGRVLKVYVDFNNKVEAGQILAEIDTEQYKARVDEASAQLAAASASLVNARATVVEAKQKRDRIRSLQDKQLAALQDLETAEATYKRAEASVSSAGAQVTLAQASLKVAKSNLAKAVIRSPIDGIVLNRAVEPGQTVTSGLQTPVLFVIAADLAELRLTVQVDEADVGHVQEGQNATFTVDAHPQKVFQSKVLAVKNMPTAGQSVVTYEAWLQVDNDNRLLRPGMTATATVVVDERKDVLLVPNAALRFSPPKRPKEQSFSVTQLLPTGRRPGMGRRPSSGGTSSGGTGSGGPQGGQDGKGGRRKPAVWQVKDGQIHRIRVETGATDGIRTEVRADELSDGVEVAVSALEGNRG